MKTLEWIIMQNTTRNISQLRMKNRMTDYNKLFDISTAGSKVHDGVHDVEIIRRYGGFHNLNDLWSERIHQLPRSVTHNGRNVEPQIARKSVEPPFAPELQALLHPPREQRESILRGEERKKTLQPQDREHSYLCTALLRLQQPLPSEAVTVVV